MSKLFRFVIAFCFIAVLMGTTYAFASANTGLVSRAGEGAAQISGWVVSDIGYQLGSDPSKIEAISFSLDRPAGAVLVNLGTADSQYYACVDVGSNRWQCDIQPGLDVSSADQLRVIATGN